jgi:hypothetical protein
MRKFAHRLVRGVKVIMEVWGLQLIIREAEAIRCDDITGECIERIVQRENSAAPFISRDARAQELNFFVYNGLKLGNVSFGEHGIKGRSTNGMEVTFDGRRRCGVSTKPARHPCISFIFLVAGIELVPIAAVFDV